MEKKELPDGCELTGWFRHGVLDAIRAHGQRPVAPENESDEYQRAACATAYKATAPGSRYVTPEGFVEEEDLLLRKARAAQRVRFVRSEPDFCREEGYLFARVRLYDDGRAQVLEGGRKSERQRSWLPLWARWPDERIQEERNRVGLSAVVDMMLLDAGEIGLATDDSARSVIIQRVKTVANRRRSGNLWPDPGQKK